MRCIVYKKCIKANRISTEIDTSYDLIRKTIQKKKIEKEKSYDLGLGVEGNSMKLMYSIGLKINEEVNVLILLSKK